MPTISSLAKSGLPTNFTVPEVPFHVTFWPTLTAPDEEDTGELAMGAGAGVGTGAGVGACAGGVGGVAGAALAPKSEALQKTPCLSGQLK